MIDKMRGRLGHVAAVAGRADAAALAGECHDERLAAARAASTGESEAEDAALEIAAEFLGRTDVSDLLISTNALTPVSEPLYAVA